MDPRRSATPFDQGRAARLRRMRPARILPTLGAVAAMASFGCSSMAAAQVVVSTTPAGGGAFRLPPLPPTPTPADPATFPRLASGKPNLTGVWSPGLAAVGGVNQPLKPDYAAKRRRHDQLEAAGTPLGDPGTSCEAYGMPRVMLLDPTEFIATDEQVTVISEELHEVRRIYLDNRAHPPKNFDPAFDGHSVGRWDGDVLVADTVGLRRQDGPIWLSEEAHIVERIRMVNRDALVIDTTITDRATLTDVWKLSRVYQRAPAGTEMQEFICTNNRNASDARGFQKSE